MTCQCHAGTYPRDTGTHPTEDLCDCLVTKDTGNTDDGKHSQTEKARAKTPLHGPRHVELVSPQRRQGCWGGTGASRAPWTDGCIWQGSGRRGERAQRHLPLPCTSLKEKIILKEKQGKPQALVNDRPGSTDVHHRLQGHLRAATAGRLDRCAGKTWRENLNRDDLILPRPPALGQT